MSYPPDWPQLPIAGGGYPGRRVQYAALPYRVRRDGEVQIRLITSRETRRWIIPKGWPIKGLTPSKTAARESYEEAGLMGDVARDPLGLYTYEKRLGTRSVICDVLVFPQKVKRLLQKWPERYQRMGFWFSIDSAAAAVQEEELSELIRSFGVVMARKWEAKLRAAQEKAVQEKAEKARPGKTVEAKPAKGAAGEPAAMPAADEGSPPQPLAAPDAGKKVSRKAKSASSASASSASASASSAPAEAAEAPPRAIKAADIKAAGNKAAGKEVAGKAVTPERSTSGEAPASSQSEALMAAGKKTRREKPKRKVSTAPEGGPSGPA